MSAPSSHEQLAFRLAMEPTHDSFRALARSSPWLWRSLTFRFRIVQCPDELSDVAPVTLRAYVRRPAGLRVESLNGDAEYALDSSEEKPPGVFALVAVSGDTPEDFPVPVPSEPIWWTDPNATQPTCDPVSGLLPTHPDLGFMEEVDDVMYGNYRWVAMLNPVELADGAPEGDLRSDRYPPVTIDELAREVWDDRVVWKATLRPTQYYDPRCSCCPLLWSRESDALEDSVEPDPSVYPTAHEIALDVETGVCTFSREIGGSHPGRGHQMHIESVNPDLGDELFKERPRRRLPFLPFRRR